MVGITFSSACSNMVTGFCLVLPSIMSRAPYTMPSATDFFPAYMIEFMNFDTTMLPNFGSGRTSRFSARWRRDIDQAPALIADQHILDRLFRIVVALTSGASFQRISGRRPARLISAVWRHILNGAVCGS